MKFEVATEFWNKQNLISKACLMIGFFFVDLGMRLGGMKTEKQIED